MTSRLGCLGTPGMSQKACWGEFSIAIYGNIAYIQIAAAFSYRRIPSCCRRPKVPVSPFSTVVVKQSQCLLEYQPETQTMPKSISGTRTGSAGKSIWLTFRRPRFESWLDLLSVLGLPMILWWQSVSFEYSALVKLCTFGRQRHHNRVEMHGSVQ